MRPENMTILTVDDTPANIRLLTHYLEKQGYRVLTAEDGFEGFKAAIQHHPDLVLLDIMMPGTDGYEVCELLKAEEETKDIPVVFLTAKADVEDRVRGFELGAVDYITKPFNLVEISARVKSHLLLKYHEKLNGRYQKALLQMQRPACLGKVGESIAEHLWQGLDRIRQDPKWSGMEKSDAFQAIRRLVEKWQAFAGLNRYENESLRVYDWLYDVADLVRVVGHGKVPLEIEKPSPSLSVFGNYGALFQALSGVFLSAIESGQKVRVSVTEEPLPKGIAPPLKNAPDERYVKIHIEQTGHRREDLAVDPDTGLQTNPKKATDLGLRFSAAQKIVQEHLGVFQWIEKDSHSSTVVMYFPSRR